MLLLKGLVVPGCRHFSRRMTDYREAFQRAVGQELYPGTLNVRVDRQIPIREELRLSGREINELEDFLFERCLINGRGAYRIRPCHPETGKGGHGDHVLEIACAEWIPNVAVGTEVVVGLFRD
jgi:CTP-dependent riboflavin kinase